MNLRWLWFDHVPPGIDLTRLERQELQARSKRLRAANPSTMHKHGALIFSVVAWSMLEAVILLFLILYLVPRVQSGAMKMWVIVALPLIICMPFWLMIALAFNRSHSPFVRRALNEMNHPVCMRCGYALRGLGDQPPRCPECGEPRDLTDATDAAPHVEARDR